MPLDYEEIAKESRYERWPKIGETKSYHIVKSERKEGASKWNFQKNVDAVLPDGSIIKTKTDAGFRYELTLGNGKQITLNNFGLLMLFKNNNIQDGDAFELKHLDKGSWEIRKIDQKLVKNSAKSTVGAKEITPEDMQWED